MQARGGGVRVGGGESMGDTLIILYGFIYVQTEGVVTDWGGVPTPIVHIATWSFVMIFLKLPIWDMERNLRCVSCIGIFLNLKGTRDLLKNIKPTENALKITSDIVISEIGQSQYGNIPLACPLNVKLMQC